jgi:tetratricopeptide (TPR) repeat protein
MKAKILISLLVVSLGLCRPGAAGESGEQDYQLAVRHAREGNWEGADSLLDRILRERPEHLPSVFLRARVLFSLRRYSESLKMARLFLEKRPESGEAHKVAGLASFMLGDQDGARGELQKATELSPRDAEAFYYLGRVFFTASNMPAALAAFENAIRNDPQSVRAHNHLGQTLEGLARFPEAKAAYQNAIKLEREQSVRSEWPFHNLGALLLQQGDSEEAAKYLREALARNPDSVAGRIKLAMALSISGRLGAAEELLHEALRLEPQSSGAHYQLGRLLTKMGRQEEARKHFAAFRQFQAQ